MKVNTSLKVLIVR